MKREIILKVAASSMMIAAVLTGCGPSGGSSVASASSNPVNAKQVAKYTQQAEKALAKGDAVNAVAFAEQSVAAVGNDPETRALLGQAYLAAGRFASAERSFRDAMELGKKDAKLILSLGLVELGQGNVDSAKRLFIDNRQFLPTADYGLALALAGDTTVAVEILEQAIRDNNVTGRTRQNLGLAYALDGRWKEAKLMALQDMTPSTVDGRIMQWAQMARPGAYETRVATMLNVTPVGADPGQPTRLALNAAPAGLAQTPANDYSREVASFDRNVPLPAIGPSPNEDSDVDYMAKENNVKVSSVALPASTVRAQAPTPAKMPAKAPAKMTEPKSAANAPASRFIVENGNKPAKANPPAVAPKPSLQKAAYEAPKPAVSNASGSHIVQLGAFSSAEGAKRAWDILTKRNSNLAAFSYSSSPVTVNGKTLYRLSATGFGDVKSASSMCAGIKAKGGNCIVRQSRGGKSVAPVQMASGAAKKLASR